MSKLVDELEESLQYGEIRPLNFSETREIIAALRAAERGVPEEWPECEEFYDLMQRYRHVNMTANIPAGQYEGGKATVDAYEAVKKWLRASLAAAPAERGMPEEPTSLPLTEDEIKTFRLAAHTMPSHLNTLLWQICNQAIMAIDLERRLIECRADNEQAYIELALEGVRPNSLAEGIKALRGRLAEAYFWNYQSRRQRAKAIDAAIDAARKVPHD